MLLPYVKLSNYFYPINLHSIRHIDKAKTELSPLHKCIKKKTQINTSQVFIHLIKYLAEVPLQIQVFFIDATSFAHQHSAIICHLSPHLFTSLLTPGIGFLLCYALSAVGPFIKVCAFTNYPLSIKIATGTFTQSLVTPTSNMNAPKLNSNCPR